MYQFVNDVALLHHALDAINFLEQHKDIQLSKEIIENFTELMREVHKRKLLPIH